MKNLIPSFATPILTDGALPDPVPFEEVAAAQPQDMASAIAFALSRALHPSMDSKVGRPVALIVTPAFQNERGRMLGWGAAGLGLAHDRTSPPCSSPTTGPHAPPAVRASRPWGRSIAPATVGSMSTSARGRS